MNNNFIDNSDKELIHIRNIASCDVGLGISKRLTGAHDRPAIFIEKNNDEYKNSTTLLNC